MIIIIVCIWISAIEILILNKTEMLISMAKISVLDAYPNQMRYFGLHHLLIIMSYEIMNEMNSLEIW